MKVLGDLNLTENEIRNGRFETLTELPSDPKVGTWAFCKKQLLICLELDSDPVWVPLTPKRDTYQHHQKFMSKVWRIQHDMNSEDVLIQCFDENNNAVVPSSVEVADENSAIVTFPESFLGMAIVLFGFTANPKLDGKLGAATDAPVGTVFNFAREAKIPEDCLPLAGQTISREYYPELVTLLAGSDAESATLDDARGIFRRNLDASKGIDVDRVEGSIQDESFEEHGHSGSIGSKDLGTKSTNSTGAHSHTFYIANTYDGSSVHALVARAMGQEGAYNRVERGGSTFTMHNVGNHAHSVAIGSHDHDLVVQNSGGSETRPENIAYILVIKAR